MTLNSRLFVAGMATGLATSATTVQQPQQVLEKETRIIEEERIIQPTTTSTFATETVSAPISRVEAPVVEYKEKAPVVQEVHVMKSSHCEVKFFCSCRNLLPHEHADCSNAGY
jgi:hypothetical protein